MKIRFSSYLTRLLLYSIIIGSIPVLIIGSLSYNIASNNIQEKVEQSNMQILAQTKSRVEQLLTTIDYNVIQFLNSYIFRYSLGIPFSSNNYSIFNEINSNLQNLQVYELGINNILYVNYDQEWFISDRGVKPLKEFKDPNKLLYYKSLNKNSQWIKEENVSADSSDEEYVGTNNSISLIKKVPAVHIKPVSNNCFEPSGIPVP